MNTLLMDNNDSFTRNLEHLLAACAAGNIDVVPYSELNSVEPDKFDLIVISPGPGRPADYPGYEFILDSGRPVLGICLGMQIINEHFGGKTDRLKNCIHGKTDIIMWRNNEIEVARYHSLHASRVGSGLRITSENSDHVPMAVEHETRKILGYQFHPESFMTEDGKQFIRHALDFFHIH